MSTVPETAAAAQLGTSAGISAVTNMAAGIQPQPITAEEVLETGRRAEGQLAALLRAVIPRMAATVDSATWKQPRRWQATEKGTRE